MSAEKVNECLHQHVKSAEEYIRKHKLLKLFRNLTAMAVYFQPDDLPSFMITQVTALKEARDTGNWNCLPQLFDDCDLEAAFTILDCPETGRISVNKYSEALKSFGASQFNEYPIVDDVSRDFFVTEATNGLKNSAAAYADPNEDDARERLIADDDEDKLP